MPRIAFDLDETLGVPLIEKRKVVKWQMRPGCEELLDQLQPEFELILWSVSPRRYVEKALSFGLSRWFMESYSWDEIPTPWKDVRRIRADFLVDDSPHHRQVAEQFGIGHSYVLVPAYGSPEDIADTLAWVRTVWASVASNSGAREGEFSNLRAEPKASSTTGTRR